jgi:hypothetical protein
MPCYMCESPATTREHVPPRSFFPQGFRTNLWTVPSCERHNLDNSMDVEYVRNVIVSHRNVHGTAQQLAQSASFRSFERRSALFFRTFRGAEQVVLDGEQTLVFRFELERFRRVMEAIAFGLFYHENEDRFGGQWQVFSPTLLGANGANDLVGIPDRWREFRMLMRRVPFQLMPTPESSVFRYGVHDFNDGAHFAYAFEFYGGFYAYVWTR